MIEFCHIGIRNTSSSKETSSEECIIAATQKRDNVSSVESRVCHV